MKRTLTILALAAVAVLSPTAAGATDKPHTIELGWVLPDGGTESNVTWPQPVYDPTAPVACDTTITIQWDTYPYKTGKDRERTDALAADGVLAYGEDHGWAKSWRFTTVTGPRCVPEQPAPRVTTETWSDTVCTLPTDGTTTTTTYARDTTIPNVWDEGTWTWIDAEPVTGDVYTTGTTVTDAAECAAVTPTPTPTVDPTPTVEPTTEPSTEPTETPAPLVAEVHTAQLAATGVEPWALVSGGIIALGVGITLIAVARRRRGGSL